MQYSSLMRSSKAQKLPLNKRETSVRPQTKEIDVLFTAQYFLTGVYSSGRTHIEKLFL